MQAVATATTEVVSNQHPVAVLFSPIESDRLPNVGKEAYEQNRGMYVWLCITVRMQISTLPWNERINDEHIENKVCID